MTDTAVKEPGDTRQPSAPYMSFQSFRNLLDQLSGQHVLPDTFDRSFFGQVSGSLVAQTRGTLKFFDLIDETYRPTDRLRALMVADEQVRISGLRELARIKYASVLDLGSNATQGQLEQEIRKTGLNGQSITKAVTFYLGLAEYTGLPVSPYFKKTSPPRSSASASGNGARRGSRRKKPPAKVQSPPTNETDSGSTGEPLEEKKLRYIDMLMKLAEGADNGDAQQDLLDRLEKALGMAE